MVSSQIELKRCLSHFNQYFFSSVKQENKKVIPRLASPKRSPKLQRSGTEIKDYGLIDQHYPPHHASNISRIPNSKSSPVRTSRIPNKKQEIPQGCAVKPCQAGKEPPSNSVTSENDESTAQMTAAFHSRTKSLPRYVIWT